MTKTAIALLAAAAVFGAVSAAQAGSRDDGDAGGGGSYGFRIGPLGQPMGGPTAWRGRPSSVYAYVPRARLDRRWRYENPYGRRVIR
jgi:hypothetical protein